MDNSFIGFYGLSLGRKYTATEKFDTTSCSSQYDQHGSWRGSAEYLRASKKNIPAVLPFKQWNRRLWLISNDIPVGSSSKHLWKRVAASRVAQMDRKYLIDRLKHYGLSAGDYKLEKLQQKRVKKGNLGRIGWYRIEKGNRHGSSRWNEQIRFCSFQKLIYDETGINMTDKKCTLLTNRIRKRLVALNIDSYNKLPLS